MGNYYSKCKKRYLFIILALALILIISIITKGSGETFINSMVGIFVLFFTAILLLTIFQYTSMERKIDEMNAKISECDLKLKTLDNKAQRILKSYEDVGSLFATQASVADKIFQLYESTKSLYSKEGLKLPEDFLIHKNASVEYQAQCYQKYLDYVVSNEIWNEPDGDNIINKYVVIMGGRPSALSKKDISNLIAFLNKCYTISNKSKDLAWHLINVARENN